MVWVSMIASRGCGRRPTARRRGRARSCIIHSTAQAPAGSGTRHKPCARAVSLPAAPAIRCRPEVSRQRPHDCHRRGRPPLFGGSARSNHFATSRTSCQGTICFRHAAWPTRCRSVYVSPTLSPCRAVHPRRRWGQTARAAQTVSDVRDPARLRRRQSCQSSARPPVAKRARLPGSGTGCTSTN
jgi:hypothetical protein